MAIEFDFPEDWRTMPELDLSMGDFDFAKIKREFAKASRPKRVKKVAPDIDAIIDEQAQAAAAAARNPRSTIRGIRAARAGLERRLTRMKLTEAQRQTAMRLFDDRWTRILVGAEGVALQARIQRWA